MRLYPGLAIVAHAQYSELNELTWCRWLRSRIRHDNDYIQPSSIAKAHSQDTVLFFVFLKYFFIEPL